ncbi:MAG TPA: chitosanase [Hyphomicrobium sp.]|nr:chitosanase [Hyphomicrobium sp.]
MQYARRRFLQLAGHCSVIYALDAAVTALGAAGRQPNRREKFARPRQNTDIHDGLAQRIKAVSNVFEVGSPEPDYAYVENLGDGRGYTVTQYGFCTYNEEVSQVIERYAADVPGNPLVRFLSQLPPVRWTGQRLEKFPAAWRKEVHTSALLPRACDEQADVLFFRPSLQRAADLGLHSAVGKSIIYDTLLQHGDADDPDSLSSIIKRTPLPRRAGDDQDGDDQSEFAFLRAFLAERLSVLKNASSPETRIAWRASTPRVDALLTLLQVNPDLTPPIRVMNREIDVVIPR